MILIPIPPPLSITTLNYSTTHYNILLHKDKFQHDILYPDFLVVQMSNTTWLQKEMYNRYLARILEKKK